jgi:hypothetical protein
MKYGAAVGAGAASFIIDRRTADQKEQDSREWAAWQAYRQECKDAGLPMPSTSNVHEWYINRGEKE